VCQRAVMVASTPRRAPTHCRATHDCLTWAQDPREGSGDRGHSTWVHENADEMSTAFNGWVDASVAAVRGCGAIQAMRLPDPNGGSPLDVGLLDPSTVVAVAAYGQTGGHEANGLYFGLVAQDPMTHWRGLTGFFLTWCPGCDDGGESLLRGLRSRLRQHGVVLRSIYDMPSALHPQDGWFERDRGLLAGHVSLRPGLSPHWVHVASGGESWPALITTGPALSDLTNVVLVERPQESVALARLRPHPKRWTWRLGDLAALEALVVLRRDRPRVSMTYTPLRSPASWGVYRLSPRGPVVGPVANLRRALTSALEGAPRDRIGHVQVGYLQAGAAARMADVLSLSALLA